MDMSGLNNQTNLKTYSLHCFSMGGSEIPAFGYQIHRDPAINTTDTCPNLEIG